MKALLLVTLIICVGLCGISHSSVHAQRNDPVAVGEVAPDFTLQDQNGNRITLSDARGTSPVVLVFYRGYW